MIGVDPHPSGFHASGYLHSSGDILRPDSAAQTIGGVVCHGDDLVFSFELDDHCHGPEDLLLGNAHFVVNVRNQRRLEEAAVFQLALGGTLTAAGNGCALLLGNFHIGGDFLDLGLVDLAADLGAGIQRISLLDLLKCRYSRSYKLIINALLDEYPGTGAADLALVEQNAQLKPVNSPVEKE